MIMKLKSLHIASSDRETLRFVAAAALARKGPVADAARNLLNELDRAVVRPPAEVPADVVRLGSSVEIKDLADGSVESYTLVLPEFANADEKRLSVLAPIGTAVLGYAEGDEIEWRTPGGLRRLRLLTVRPPPAL
jgi:regulator of nucleoside diphosphate kinase